MPARKFHLINDDFSFMEEANMETLGVPLFKLVNDEPLQPPTMTVTEYDTFEISLKSDDTSREIYSIETTKLAENFPLQPIFDIMNNIVSDSQIIFKHSQMDFRNLLPIKIAVLDLNKNSDFSSPLTPFCELFKTTLKLHHHDTPGITSVKVQVIDDIGVWNPAQIGPFAYPEIYYLRPESALQTWLIVKSDDVKKLLNLLPKKSPNQCSNIFCHSNIVLTHEWITSVGIKFSVIKQRPGEYMVIKAGTLYQIASSGTAIMDKCAVYLNRCVLESRLSYLCCCVDMRRNFDAGTWYSFNSLRDKEENEYLQAFQGDFKKRLPIERVNDNNQPSSSNQMTPDVARQYVQMVASNIASAQIQITQASETPESQKKDSNPSALNSQAEANPQSKRFKSLKQGIVKKINLRRDKISKYYESNTNANEILILKEEIAELELDRNAVGRLQEMESIINEIGRKDASAQLAINRLRFQGYFSFDKFRDFFDNSNAKTKKTLMEALDARRAKIDYNFWTSLVNDYDSWRKVFGQKPDVHRVPVFAHKTI